MPQSNNDKKYRVEEARICAAYAKWSGNALYPWFKPSHLYMMQDRERQILVAMEQHGFTSFDTIEILEIGCGTGFWLRDFIKWGIRPENITGVDPLSDQIALARQLCPESVAIECGSATNLGFSDGCFDLVLQSTVFSSILDHSIRQQIASEMLRVVKADGAILWYDFLVNNPRNPDVQGINKREIFQLFPGCRVDLRRITLGPPLARCLAPYSLLMCYFMERCKVFNTHLGVIRKE